jgi:DMSO/TMAO reductase YedYZ molybdopterin-dependent catalytic subunit
VFEVLAGKKPLIKQSYRPPNYETPVEYFNTPFTPNERFFVRWHHAGIPEVAAGAWRLRVGGDAVERPMELDMAALQRDFPTVEVAALCLCSGNRRGLFQPAVTGVQWGNGAMGNARWRGVRLRDMLHKAGLKTSALEVSFDAADQPVLPRSPDFAKSLPLAKALDPDTLIAFAMNDEPLPHWNGFPARLVVPGWTATYWVKQLTAIEVRSQPFDGFWMKTAYRIPKDRFASRGDFMTQETAANMPITAMVVNSLITNLENGQAVPRDRPLEIRGVAWDGGSGIARVDISTDGGGTWKTAQLDTDYGPYSWRQWRAPFQADRAGSYRIMARATSRAGISQPVEAVANPSGYHHNAMQTVAIVAV